MNNAAVTRRRVIEFARLGLGLRDEFLHALERARWLRHQQCMPYGDQADGGEITRGGCLFVQQRQYQQRAGVGDKQGVAVGRGAGGEFCANQPARAAAIVHHQLLPQ